MARTDELIDAVGTVCEMMGLLLEHLQNNGFTREEAVYIIAKILKDKF